MKGLSSWDDIAVLNVYVPVKKASIHMKQKLIELKRKSKIKEKGLRGSSSHQWEMRLKPG